MSTFIFLPRRVRDLCWFRSIEALLKEDVQMREISGAGGQDRTDDLLITNVTRSIHSPFRRVTFLAFPYRYAEWRKFNFRWFPS